MKHQDPFVKSIFRAVSVIKSFTQHELELGASDIARRTGISRAQAFRILKTLTAAGLLEQNGNTRKYTLGPLLFTLGSLYLETNDLVKANEPVTKILNELTGEAIFVGVFDKGNITFIMKEEAKGPFRIARNIGSVLPAHATSLGKAFLSELTEKEIDDFYPEEELELLTPKTIATKTKLKQELQHIKETGVATNIEGDWEGSAGVGCLIRNSSGSAVAAMSIAVPIFKLGDSNLKRFSTLLKMGCSLASYRLGYQDIVNPVHNIEDIRSWWKQRTKDIMLSEVR